MIKTFEKDGKKFLQLEYQLDSLKIISILEMMPHPPNQVKNEQLFKSNKPRSSIYGEIIASGDANDFISEMNMIFTVLNEHHLELFQQKKLNEQNIQEFSVVYFNAFAYLCTNHIEQFKRLITTDMDGYLDKIMLFFNATYQTVQYSNIPEHIGKQIRESFEFNIINHFKEFIYVPKPSPNGGWDLIRLSDA